MSSFIVHTSFGSLPSAQKSTITNYLDAHRPGSANNPETAQKLKHSNTLFTTSFWPNSRDKRQAIATQLVLQANPAGFKYLSPAQSDALRQDLQLAYYQLCDAYYTDENEHRRQNLADQRKAIDDCLTQLDLLERTAKGENIPPTAPGEEKANPILDHIILKLRAINCGKTVYLRQWMCDFNLWRLYWVWAGNLLRTTLGLLPDNFYHKQQTQYATTAPQVTLGYISWALYYARFLLDLSLLFKHTIRGPWMSGEEKNLGWQKRFKQQWQERKFKLINDFIWATTNLATFYWLVGSGIWGYAGNILTTCLLVGDALLTKCRQVETLQAMEEDIRRYRDEINALRAKQQALAATSSGENQHDQDILTVQIARMQYILSEYQFDAEHRKRSVNAELVYAISLLASFVLMCSCLIPENIIAASSSMGIFLSLSGSALCFIVSFIYSAYSAYIEVSKTQDAQLRALQECKTILKTNRDLTELEYLRYMELRQSIAHQRQAERYQRHSFARKVAVEALIPFLVFSAFTFASFGVAVTIMAIGVSIAVIWHIWVQRQKPTRVEQPQMNVEERQRLNDGDSKSLLLQQEINPAINRVKPSSNKLLNWLLHTPSIVPENIKELNSVICGV